MKLALVVDDSRVARMKLIKALREYGCEVIEAVNGKHALEVLGEFETPDVAFVDWNMPEMNGLELVKQVRKESSYAEMVIMMVTSETEPRQMVQALNAGADEYLMKPYTKDALFEKLELLGIRVQHD